MTTVHATEFGRHQGWVQTYPQSRIHAAERGMVRRADHVITVSEFMGRHVAGVFGVEPSHVTVIPNGIDPADLAQVADDLPALRARFAEPGERLVLLVGRLVYEKGFPLALDALAPVIRARRDVRFVVAGTGTAEEELKRQARRLRMMRAGTFLGWVGDDMLHSLYRVADLCIVPSIYEPFGLVALEAMASGCPCIVSDVGGLREVVPAGGSVGHRFRSRDVDALRSVVEQVLGDDEARAAACRSRPRARALVRLGRSRPPNRVRLSSGGPNAHAGDQRTTPAPGDTETKCVRAAPTRSPPAEQSRRGWSAHAARAARGFRD